MVLDAVGMAEAVHHLFSFSLLPETADWNAPAVAAAEGDADYHAEAAKARSSTKDFLRRPTLLYDIAVQRCVASVFSGLKYSMLDETSAEFEQRQVLREAEACRVQDQQLQVRLGVGDDPGAAAPTQGASPDDTGPESSCEGSNHLRSPVAWWPASARQFRGAVGFNDNAAGAHYLAKVSNMFWEAAEWPVKLAQFGRMDAHHSRAQRLEDAFRILSRAGACVQEYVVRPQQGYPQKLIATLERPELIRAVVRDLAHCPDALDELSARIVEVYFVSAGRLREQQIKEGRHVIQALADVVELDAVAVECDHAGSRRKQKARVQTHLSTVAWTSAARLCGRVRWPDPGTRRKQDAAGSTQGRCSRRKRAGSHAPRRKGGGGAWRAHLATRAERNLDGRWKAGASRAYVECGENVQRELARLGGMARVERTGFGGRTSRQANTDHRASRVQLLVRQQRRQHFLGARPVWDRAAAVAEAEKIADEIVDRETVSYTHLTLPTIYSV